MRTLLERDVRFYPGTELAEWTAAHAAILRDVQRGTEIRIDQVDNVVGAIGSTSENWLAAELRDKVELRVIGDANVPGTVENATYQGALLGRTL